MSQQKEQTQTESDLQAACQAFVDGFAHFCGRIDFNKTFLDAEAIRWFNVVPAQIEKALIDSKGDD